MGPSGAGETGPSKCRDCGGGHETGSRLCPVQPVPDPPSLVGKLVADKYRVVGVLGTGGVAAVYEAVNESIGKRVALKILQSNLLYSEQAVRRFYQEARTVAALGHENLVEVYDLGWTEERVPFIVMEFLQGRDLGECLRAGERFDVGRAVWIASQVLAGLEAAHRAGVVHRDLKPANVMIAARPGGGEIVKVLDFGIALVGTGEATRLTRQAQFLGTAQYVAPEQVINPSGVDARADVHAVGVLLYALLAGRPPYLAAEDVRATFYRVLEQEPPPLEELAPHVPPEVVDAVHRALEKDPENRFDSAATMLDAIAPFLEWTTTVKGEFPAPPTPERADAPTATQDVRPSGRRARKARPRSRRRALLAGVFLLVAGLLGGIALAVQRATEAEPRQARIADLQERVRVRVSVEPEDAAVFLDGVSIGANPGAVRVPREDALHVLRAESRGYRTREVEFRAEEGSVRLVLEPEEAEPEEGEIEEETATPRLPARRRVRPRPRVIEKNPYR